VPEIELPVARPPPPNRLRRGDKTGPVGAAGGGVRRDVRQRRDRAGDDVVGHVLRQIAPLVGTDARRSRPGAGRAPAFGRGDVEAFATLAISPDGDLWPPVERALRIGVSVDQLFEELLAPAARRLGALWDEDDCDFLSVTVAAHRLQVAVRRLALAHRRAGEGPATALFSPAPGEPHILGLSIARAAFERSGWSTEVADGAGPCAAVRRRWFDLVAFSISCDRLIQRLADLAAEVRAVSKNRNVFLLVGGAAVAAKPESATRIGADAIAATPREAIVITRSLLRRSEWRESG